MAWAIGRMELPFLEMGKTTRGLNWGGGTSGWDIIEFEMPFIPSYGHDKKAVAYMSCESQEQVWAGIRNLESTALRMYLNP